MQFLRRLVRNNIGQDIIEYALLAGFAAVAVFLIMVPDMASIIRMKIARFEHTQCVQTADGDQQVMAACQAVFEEKIKRIQPQKK